MARQNEPARGRVDGSRRLDGRAGRGAAAASLADPGSTGARTKPLPHRRLFTLGTPHRGEAAGAPGGCGGGHAPGFVPAPPLGRSLGGPARANGLLRARLSSSARADHAPAYSLSGWNGLAIAVTAAIGQGPDPLADIALRGGESPWAGYSGPASATSRRGDLVFTVYRPSTPRAVC